MSISVIFSRIGKAFKIAGSAVICWAALILPYRLRESFVFVMHFALNGVLVKLKLLLGWISAAFGFVFFLPVYYAGLPLTIALRKIFSRARGFENADRPVDDSRIYRMF